MTVQATKLETVEPPVPVESKGDVATIAKPRLAYHPLVSERFGVDRAAWKALVEAVWPAAQTSDAVILALSYCKARKLDPFKRVVHIVPVWDGETRAYIETVWPGIAEHRTTAFRTKQYAGADAAKFGEAVKRTFNDKIKQKDGYKDESVEIEFPKWAQITVYRMIDGQRVPMPGPRVYWLETYSRRGRSILPNERWARAPFQMIEKCAEAAALRRAFPEELGDEPTSDEVGAYHQPGDSAKDITPETEKPTRQSAAGAAVRATEPEPDPAKEVEFVDLDGEARTFASLADYKVAFLAAIAEAASDEKLLRGLMESNQAEMVAVHAIQSEVSGDIAEAYDTALKAAQAKAAETRAESAPAATPVPPLAMWGTGRAPYPSAKACAEHARPIVAKFIDLGELNAWIEASKDTLAQMSKHAPTIYGDLMGLVATRRKALAG